MAKSTEFAEMQMQLALDACRAVSDPNFSAIACEFPPVNRQTLKRRFNGKQGSRASASSIHWQNLTNKQEDELIKLINSLTLCGLPPTSSIVWNLAEEMILRLVGKNWTGQFIQRHKDKLKSMYLRNIDNIQTQSEYALIIQHFFDLVLYCITVLYSS
jgi:hypothetical protein